MFWSTFGFNFSLNRFADTWLNLLVCSSMSLDKGTFCLGEEAWVKAVDMDVFLRACFCPHSPRRQFKALHLGTLCRLVRFAAIASLTFPFAISSLPIDPVPPTLAKSTLKVNRVW